MVRRVLPMCSIRILPGDKGHDGSAIRRQAEDNGTMPNLPLKADRCWNDFFSPLLSRGRNAMENTFCRLTDFRCVATRNDRNAVNFLMAVCIATRRQLLFVSTNP